MNDIGIYIVEHLYSTVFSIRCKMPQVVDVFFWYENTKKGNVRKGFITCFNISAKETKINKLSYLFIKLWLLHSMFNVNTGYL